MNVLILLAFAAVGQCALLGSNKCTWGPSYWCSHVSKAKECGAMQHCVTTVWKNQNSAMIGATETCFDIIRIIDAVRMDSELHLLEKMSVGCTAFPVDKRALCSDVLEKNKDEVFTLLQSDLPSNRIASALGLCGSYPDTVPHAVPQEVGVTGDYCQDCVNFFSDLREILNNSEAQVEDFVKNDLCSKFGPVQDLCVQLADQYIDMVYKIILQQMDPNDLCFLLQLCKNATHAEVMKSLKYLTEKQQVKSAECDVCKSLIGDLQTALKDPSVQKQIETELEDKVCPLFGTMADQCKSYVQAYAPIVFQLLLSELDPQSLCTQIGMCTNGTKTTTLNPFLPMVAVPLAQAAIANVRILPTPQKEALPGVCALCEFIMKELAAMLVNNATEAEMKAALEKVCDLLPKSLRTECTDFIETYADMIIQLLLQEVSVTEVCTVLGLCTSAQAPAQVAQPALIQPVSLKVSDTKCMICEQVVAYLKKELQDPNTENTIDQLLKTVCQIFPSSLRAECQQFVDTYTPTLIMLFEQFADPKEICTALSLCMAAQKSASKPTNPFVAMMELTPAKPKSTGSLLGSKKCTWGPSYWCQNEHTARECNALQHCVKYQNMKIEA